MSRAVPTATFTGSGVTDAEVPGSTTEGMSGPASIGVLTIADPRIRQETQRLLERARELRPLLRAEQADTEKRGTYSPVVHQHFLDAGFYRMLLPRTFGGLELGVSAFYQVIAEVARGCASTAWCLCLAAGHSLQVGSYWPEQAQREIFRNGYMIAPASGKGRDVELVRVDGGYRLSGTWQYASGSPYSTHFLPSVVVPSDDPDRPGVSTWMAVSREAYTILDNWGNGGVIGMRGSGSNGIRVEDAFVPDHYVVEESWWGQAIHGPTPGSELHGNPVYAGAFVAFAEGEVAAVIAGLGMAAVDEYARILSTTAAPRVGMDVRRAEHVNWQRSLGEVLGWVDSAQGLSARAGAMYEEYAARSAAGVEAFSDERALRLSSMHFTVEELTWNAIQQMLKTAGTSASHDGQRLQRYFRDMVATRTRTDQYEFFAASTGVLFLNQG